MQMYHAEPPEDSFETARFEMSLYTKPDGETGVVYTKEGSRTDIIGCLIIMLDRLRDLERQSWDSDDEDKDEI